MSKISLNAYSPQYSDEQDQRNRAKRAAKKLEIIAQEKVAIAGQLVKGLCPKKDSCTVCRAARMADKEYMSIVNDRATKWAKYEKLATIDNAIAHAVLNPRFK